MKLISWCFSSKWRFGHPGTRGAATYFSHQRNGRRRKLNQIGSLLTPHLLMIKTRRYFLFSAWKIEIFFPKEISLLNVRNTVNRIEDCIGKGLWHLHENGRGGASCQWKLWPEFSCHTPSSWRLPRHWKPSSSSRSSSGISVKFLMDCFLWPTICVSDWKQLQLSRVQRQQMELQQTFVKVFPHTQHWNQRVLSQWMLTSPSLQMLHKIVFDLDNSFGATKIPWIGNAGPVFNSDNQF